MIEWHKINWDKVEKYLDLVDNEDHEMKFWKVMASNANMQLDTNYNLPLEFTWELGYRAGLLMDNKKKYLCYEIEEDLLYFAIYDDEQDHGPCFWTDEHDPDTCFPDFWTDAEILKPIKS